MNKRKMGFIIFGGLFASWIYLVFPTFLQVFGFTPIVFPNKQFTLIENVGLLCTCLSVAGFSLVLGVEEMKQSYTESDVVGKKLNFHLIFVTCFIILFSTPLVYSYVFEQQQQAMSQTIINLVLLDDDFSGHPPGSAPDNWYPLDGNWTLVNDGGNLVYYQADNSDKEALSISTIGDPTWINYRFETDLKFAERNTKKDDAGALLLFHYQASNSYYFVWLKEYQNQLELYNHGAEGGGASIALTSCNLVPNIWYHVIIEIRDEVVNVSINGVAYFTNINMNGAYHYGSVAIGTRYYKVMFDNIEVNAIS